MEHDAFSAYGPVQDSKQSLDEAGEATLPALTSLQATGILAALLVLLVVAIWCALGEQSEPTFPISERRIAQTPIAEMGDLHPNAGMVSTSSPTQVAVLLDRSAPRPVVERKNASLEPIARALFEVAKKVDLSKWTTKPPEKSAPEPLITNKRLDRRTEGELRQMLAIAPEISLLGAELQPLIEQYTANYAANKDGNLEPTTLLSVRPDLKQLPIRHGAGCRIPSGAADRLTVLSRKLHLYLAIDTPMDSTGQRPHADQLLRRLEQETRRGRPEWLRPNAIPILIQLLGHEDKPVRLMLVELLREITGREASAVLAGRAVFDLSSEVRDAALFALAQRPAAEYRDVLIYGLFYPWAPPSEHAAEALVALEDREAVPELVTLLQKPDPTAPYRTSKNQLVKREVVRINHQTNCLMCHPPAVTTSDPVLGLVPGATLVSTGRLGSVYGGGGAPIQVKPLWIRADVAYLRQDFAIQQFPIASLAGVPFLPTQRTDYLVRERPLSASEAKRWLERPEALKSSDQRQALLFALRQLSGKDLGTTFADWKALAPPAPPAKPALKDRRVDASRFPVR